MRNFYLFISLFLFLAFNSVSNIEVQAKLNFGNHYKDNPGYLLVLFNDNTEMVNGKTLPMDVRENAVECRKKVHELVGMEIYGTIHRMGFVLDKSKFSEDKIKSIEKDMRSSFSFVKVKHVNEAELSKYNVHLLKR